jgi:hypothetical protein
MIQIISNAFSLTPITDFLLFMALGWFYYALMISSKWMGTIGYKVNSIWVTDVEARPIGFGKASLRYLFSLLSSLFILLNMTYFFTKRKQALHDLLAGTVVLSNFNEKLYERKKGKLTYRSGYPIPDFAKPIVMLVGIFFLMAMLYFFYIAGIFASGMGLFSNYHNGPGAPRTGMIGYKLCNKISLSDPVVYKGISSIIRGENGCYYTLGEYDYARSRTMKSWLAKWDYEGKIIWQREVGLNYREYAPSYLAYNHGVLLAVREMGNMGSAAVKFSAFDQNGTALWQKDVVENMIQIHQIIPRQGHFICVGTFYSDRVQGNEIVVMEIAPNGQIISRREYDGGGWGEGYAIVNTVDGGYLVGGTTEKDKIDIQLGKKTPVTYESAKPSKRNALIFKADSNGTIEWEKIIDRNRAEEVVKSITLNSANEIIAVADVSYHDYSISDKNDLIVFKMSEKGELVWRHMVWGNNSENALSIADIGGKNYIVAANTTSYGVGGWLIRFDDMGRRIGDRSLGTYGGGIGWIHSVLVEKKAKMIAIAGETQGSNGTPLHGDQVYFLQADSNETCPGYPHSVARQNRFEKMEQAFLSLFH